jgi:[histone H3]-trimethyl-L-lysine4 demethylase
MSIPDYDWHCPKCLVGTGEYGFEEGGIYSLKQFQEKANNFKDSYFAPKQHFDPVLNTKRPVTEDDTEREFWKLVESLTETVEVEYGADIHSTTHGSGFPTVETHPLDPYSTNSWNLNVLPLHLDSLFRHIKSDISGMTVPWLYVGMCFSTFCWHNEDHYTYSANYQHFGATKTWYGIPGADADAFEEAMRQAVPELFETQPDLLFQLVTLLPPDQLRKAGVNVYALDQRAGQFVVTFPQAYHAGFNHGFNFNEAVNFAPSDWEPFGESGVERLKNFRRQPCFSHDELLLTAAARDATIKTAKWLAPALERMRDRELQERKDFVKKHKEIKVHNCEIEPEEIEIDAPCEIGFELDDTDLSEEDYQCSFCKAFTFLSQFRCKNSGKVVCLLHAVSYDCCEESEEHRLTSPDHTIRYRISDSALNSLVQKVVDRAIIPEAWSAKLDKALEDESRPALKTLQTLVAEGEKITYPLPGLEDLLDYVKRCNTWVEEANNYITRKQQNRRKNEKAWRKGSSKAQWDEKDRELRRVEKIHQLLADAEELSFDCPQITTLRERAEDIEEFQRKAITFLGNPAARNMETLVELIEEAKTFNVDMPQLARLEEERDRMEWRAEAVAKRAVTGLTLDQCDSLIQRAGAISIESYDVDLIHYSSLKREGEIWDKKANELVDAETVNYQQLDALATQAQKIPVKAATLQRVENILKKQKEAQREIMSLLERSKDPDFRKRPKYKEVREIMEGLTDLNSKPTGTIDLEKEQRRHEDWMRKGKKLFGKANAPLHILYQHMKFVENHNKYCFDLSDKPRNPVEPPSRGATPEEDEERDDTGRDVFCICRQPEAGMMIECELCHEW